MTGRSPAESHSFSVQQSRLAISNQPGPSILIDLSRQCRHVGWLIRCIGDFLPSNSQLNQLRIAQPYSTQAHRSMRLDRNYIFPGYLVVVCCLYWTVDWIGFPFFPLGSNHAAKATTHRTNSNTLCTIE